MKTLNRFDYIQYDEKGNNDQATFKQAFQALENQVNSLLVSERAKALVFTKLEEAYLWIGKALRDDQFVRSGGTIEMNEQRRAS